MYRDNDGKDLEKEELRRQLEAAECEIQRLQEKVLKDAFWTKKRYLTAKQEAVVVGLGLLFAATLLLQTAFFYGKVERAVVHRNAVVYSVNYFRSSRVNARCDSHACQGRDNQGRYVILHCDTARCWRVW